MPYKKKYTKKRRTYRKKSKSMMSKSSSLPIGKKFLFKSRYVETQKQLVSTLGGAVTQIYNLSSLYDPDTTGTGHQPLGFDQIMPMYDHYTVIGARARISFDNQDNTQGQIVCLSIRDSQSASTNITSIIENGLNKWVMLSAATGGSSTKTLTINYSAKEFFGVRSVLGEHNHRGTSGGSPAENAFLHLTVQPNNLAAGSSPVQYTITIEYIAVMTEPKLLAQS